MYTLALVILLGFIASQVTSFVLGNVSFLKNIPVLNKDDNWFIAASIIIVWVTDTSILARYGIGSTTEWIDVVGSGLAVAGAANVSNAVLNWLDR